MLILYHFIPLPTSQGAWCPLGRRGTCSSLRNSVISTLPSEVENQISSREHGNEWAQVEHWNPKVRAQGTYRTKYWPIALIDRYHLLDGTSIRIAVKPRASPQVTSWQATSGPNSRTSFTYSTTMSISQLPSSVISMSLMGFGWFLGCRQLSE